MDGVGGVPTGEPRPQTPKTTVRILKGVRDTEDKVIRSARDSAEVLASSISVTWTLQRRTSTICLTIWP